MPLNSESLPTHSRQEFCLALKAARERKGITLDEIAEATKIPAFLFAALESCDLRRWPTGIFRRSFFRDYVRMIGVPVTEACTAFVRLFVEDEKPELIAVPAAVAAVESTDVRLALDTAWHGPHASALSRVLAAVIDAGAVMFLATALAWVAGIGWLTATALIAMTYFFFATALLGESPGRWAIARHRLALDTLMNSPAAIAAAWQKGVHGVTHMFDKTDGEPPQRAGEPEPRAWVSDARRVGPARLRVRIKLPE